MNSQLIKIYLFLLLLLPLNALALNVETDWLEMEVGFEDKTTGTKLKSIESTPDAEQQLITVAIPKSSIKDQQEIEEIIIIGHKPTKEEFKIPFTYEWAKDFENDYYGLIIKLNKKTNYPIRIYFKDDITNDLSP